MQVVANAIEINAILDACTASQLIMTYSLILSRYRKLRECVINISAVAFTVAIFEFGLHDQPLRHANDTREMKIMQHSIHTNRIASALAC